MQTISERPLEPIIEPTATIHVGTQRFGISRISTIERSLLEAAHRPRRVGGIATVLEALHAAQPNNHALTTLAEQLNLANGLRRLASLNRRLRLNKLDEVPHNLRHGRPIALDPTDSRTDGPLDTTTGVRWPGPIEELAEIINQ